MLLHRRLRPPVSSDGSFRAGSAGRAQQRSLIGSVLITEDAPASRRRSGFVLIWKKLDDFLALCLAGGWGRGLGRERSEVEAEAGGLSVLRLQTSNSVRSQTRLRVRLQTRR